MSTSTFAAGKKKAALPIFTAASTNIESGNGIAVDTLNQWIYVVGRFTNNSTFPSIPASQMNGGTNNGNKDGFLCKLSFSGTLLWVVDMGSFNNDEAVAVTVGPDQNVYLTGYYSGTAVFNSTSGPGFNLAPANSQEDIFLASYDSNGIMRWAKSSGGPHFDKGLGVATSATGVYTCGIYEKDAVVGGMVVNPTYNDINTYLWKTDFAGNNLWMIEAKSNSDDYNEALSVQELKMDVCTFSDTAYVMGYMGGSSFRFTNPSGTLLSSPILNNSDPGPDLFVYSASNAGAINWAVSFSNNSPNIQGYGIAADCFGVYVTGSIHDNAVFPSTAPAPTISTGDHDFPFVAALDHTTGVDLWIRTMGGAVNHQDVTYDVAADGYGYLYVTGRFKSNPFQMPDTTITGAVDNEVFLSKYRNNGDFIWTRNTTSIGDDMGYGLATYRNTKVFVTGEYSQNLNFGSVSTTSSSNQNLFVSSFNAGATVYYSCCTIPSIAGTASAGPLEFCPGTPVNLSLTGDTGLIHWQVSYDSGATWTNIPGAVSDSVNYTPTANHPWFRARVQSEACAPVFSNTITEVQYETIAPVITGCPANQNVNTQPGLCSAAVTWTAPTVNDNCAGATIVQTGGPSNGSFFPKGMTSITYVATDMAGNTDTCSFTVTVADNENPVISACPASIVVPNDPGVCTANVSWIPPSASDNCPGLTLVQTAGAASGSDFPEGITTIVYTATDSAGNTSTCSFTITVNDAEAPQVIGCPGTITSCSQVIDYDLPTATDNCSAVTIQQTDTTGLTSGSLFPVGTTIQSFSFTDSTGNFSTCVFDVTVLPEIDPSFASLPDTFCFNAAAIDLDLTVVLHPGETSYFYGSAGAVIEEGHLFYPALSSTGIHQIYQVVSNTICSDTGLAEVYVLKHYQSDWALGDTVCAASGLLALDSLLLPGTDPGGIWFLNGIPALIDPDLHLFPDSTIELMYFVGEAGCNDTTIHQCWVAPEASAAWNFMNDTACSTFTTELNTLVSGTPGGTWSGTGVSGSQFDATTLSGLQYVEYTSGVPTCRVSQSDSIFIYAQPVIDAGPETQVCGHDYLMQPVIDLGSINWHNAYINAFFSDSTLAGSKVTVSDQGNYVFHLTVTNGICKSTDSVNLVFWEPPTAQAGTDQYLDFTTSAEVTAYTPLYGTGEWTAELPVIGFANPYDTATTAYHLLPGNNVLYWTVTNGNCPQVRDEMVIHVNELFIPTGFSPNGDGINDFFEIKNIGNFENRLQVFNRWGQVVFEAHNYNNGWDGKDKASEILPDDTYFYTLALTDLPVFSGYVVLKKQ